MAFRLDGKAFFLTYPHCTLTREQLRDAILTKLAANNPTDYIVAIEEHEDGTPHLHMLVVCERKKSVGSAKYFDVAGFHGNYQTARNRLKVFDYCNKSDSEALNTFTPESLRCKTEGKRKFVAEQLLAGKELEEIVEEYPNFLFGYKRLKEDLQAYKEDKIVYQPLPYFLPNPWGRVIPTENSQKRRHCWFYSTVPNRGKTTWAKELQANYGAYIKSADFTYWNITGRETLIVLDDYNMAGIRYNALNQLCDGTYEARVFMGGVRKLGPKLVIVLSNQTIKDLYPFMFSLLEARFIEFCLD